MTTVRSNQDPHDIEREAVAWVNRLTSGQATVSDAAALRRWCAKSPSHSQAFSAARGLWSDLEPAGRNWRKRAQHWARVRPLRSAPAPSRRAFLAGGAVAASVAGAYVVAHPPFGLWPSWSELAADYRTGTGEQRDVTFAGSSIRLNTQTSLAVRSSDDDTGHIELIAGEAAFTTRAAQGRTLAVFAAGRWIMASAARFDVRHVEEQSGWTVCVTCLEGALEVSRDDDVIRLESGRQLRYDREGLQDISLIDIEQASAWQRGVLIFRATPLMDAVTEINRYRTGKIIVTSGKLARMPVSGRFRIDRLNDVLAQFEQAFGARLRQFPGGIVLLS